LRTQQLRVLEQQRDRQRARSNRLLRGWASLAFGVLEACVAREE
jgi:hypothetical protein